MLGSLATAAGLVLAILAGWMMTWAVFEVPFRLDLGRIVTVWLWVTGVTVIVGLIGSRGALARPPLCRLTPGPIGELTSSILRPYRDPVKRGAARIA